MSALHWCLQIAVRKTLGGQLYLVFFSELFLILICWFTIKFVLMEGKQNGTHAGSVTNIYLSYRQVPQLLVYIICLFVSLQNLWLLSLDKQINSLKIAIYLCIKSLIVNIFIKFNDLKLLFPKPKTVKWQNMQVQNSNHKVFCYLYNCQIALKHNITVINDFWST